MTMRFLQACIAVIDSIDQGNNAELQDYGT